MDIERYLRESRELVDKALRAAMERLAGSPALILDSMKYSLFSGGKRLRPVLALASAEAVGGRREQALPAACAVELIHTYSLIHDDLPCMDDDDFRRGVPTLHKVYGEAMAVLAGDALLTLAFEVLATAHGSPQRPAPAVLVEAIREVAGAAGACGLVGGQVEDLSSEGATPDRELLERIHRRKTGALFRATVRSGAILGGAAPRQLELLTRFAEDYGFAFQIHDDVLNVSGDESVMGKPRGTDSSRGKVTYPALLGLEGSRQLARDMILKAASYLEPLGEKAEALKRLALYTLERAN